MNKHRQFHSLVSKSSVPIKSKVGFNGRVVDYLSVCQIDRFFEQPQNKTSAGWIDTSPYAASTPSAEQHVTPLQGGRVSSKMSNEDVFETTVSKHCQTLAEVSSLAKGLHKPVKEDYEEPTPEPTPDAVPAPVSD